MLEQELSLAADKAVRLLMQTGKTLSTAESCTGGMLGQSITSVPGASAVFGFGFITYANAAKQRLLGVKAETLAAFGAVSEQTAREMALGARKVSGADAALSVTGIAGPGGGTPEKPVGLVYVGISTPNISRAVRLMLEGSRGEIRLKTCLCALELLCTELNAGDA